MTLTTRSSKGAELTYTEVDENWTHLLDAANHIRTIRTITASTTQTLAGAPTLGYGVNIVTQSGTDGSVALPNATGSGKEVSVICDATFRIQVFPQTGEDINEFGVNTAFLVQPREQIKFVDIASGLWQFETQLPFFYPINFLTANAGGGQASATILAMGLSVLDAVATAGDSYRLPGAAGGCNMVAAHNQDTKRADIFPASGESLNDYSANLAISATPGGTYLFLDIGPSPDQWVGGKLGRAQETILCPSNNVALNPTDGTTYYFGKWAPIENSEGANRIYFREGGRIKAVYVQTIVLGTLGTTEKATASVRVNASVDTEISDDLVYDSVLNTEISNTALNIVIAPGDFIELKVVMPTFSTNPTSVYHAFQIVFEGQ